MEIFFNTLNLIFVNGMFIYAIAIFSFYIILSVLSGIELIRY